MLTMGAKVHISLVESRFEKLAAGENINWDELQQYACGTGVSLSLCEPIIKIESDGEIFAVEDSGGWSSFHDRQLPGSGLYAVCTDSRGNWFSQDDHKSSGTWFACNALYSDMVANEVDPGSFSYSREGFNWRYKDEDITVGISSDVSSEKKITILQDGQIVEPLT